MDAITRLSLLAAAFAAAAVGAAAAAAGASRAACGAGPYVYAGLVGSRAGFGVAATITPIRLPPVVEGHVAAWTGVGGYGLGPNGSDEWLQAGISKIGDRAPALYYELALPGETPRYVMLKGHLSLTRSYRVAVLESRRRPGWWSVWANGTQVTREIFLPGSHGAWAPVATAESWNGTAATCNPFAFRFTRVEAVTRPGGGWSSLRGRVLRYPGARVVQAHDGLLASGGRA